MSCTSPRTVASTSFPRVCPSRRSMSGSVWINRHGIVAPDIPFGGMKQSGVGRSNGDPGLDAYCELKTLSIALPKTA